MLQHKYEIATMALYFAAGAATGAAALYLTAPLCNPPIPLNGDYGPQWAEPKICYNPAGKTLLEIPLP